MLVVSSESVRKFVEGCKTADEKTVCALCCGTLLTYQLMTVFCIACS